MSTRSNRLILVVVPLWFCSIIIFLFSTLGIIWKIAVVLGIGAITYGLWRISERDIEGGDADTQTGDGTKKMSLQELSILLEYNDAIISILNEDMHTLFRSPAAARITGWPDAEFGLRAVSDHCHPDDCGLFSQVFHQSIGSPDVPHHIIFRLRHKRGHYIWLEGWVTNMLHRPAVRGVVTNLRDVTALKKMAAETEKNRRFYQFLSEVNHMIVHARTEEQLFSEACRTAVTTGGYRYAFIALKSEVSDHLSLYSYAGTERYNSIETGTRLLHLLNDAAENVLNNDTCFIENTDERWTHVGSIPDNEPFNDTASQLILLRISAKDQPAGIAGIWSAPGNLFDEAEISLLKEMATDISFSLSHLREEQLRLKTQRELLESEQRYQVLAESAPVGIFHTDKTGYTTYVNPRWRQISGMEKSSALGDDWLAAVHPADRERLRQGWENATQVNRTSSTSEYRFLKPDGSVVYVLGLAVAQTNLEGEVTGYIGTIIDITERKKAEEKILALLQEVTNEKALSDSIINSLPGIFYLYDRTGRFIRWNTNFATVSGYNDEAIGRMHPLDFVSGEEKQQTRNKINETFEAGEATLQAEFLTASGKRIPYYFTGKMIHYKGEPCLLGVGIDFTERVMAQRKIRETNDQLRLLAAHLQDVREEERKSIGREIHDELGQTLTAIKMDIAWIDKRVRDDEVLANKLKNVTTLLDRSNSSVRRILTQLRPGIFQSGDLLDAIGWLIRQFSDTSGIPVNFTCNREQLQLPDAVTTCIFRVTQEALTNITRYADAGAVQYSLLAEGEWIELTIQDDGRGFDPATVASHKSFGILGMQERVLSLGGSFELTSAEGKGTQILIRVRTGDSGSVSADLH